MDLTFYRKCSGCERFEDEKENGVAVASNPSEKRQNKIDRQKEEKKVQNLPEFEIWQDDIGNDLRKKNSLDGAISAGDFKRPEKRIVSLKMLMEIEDNENRNIEQQHTKEEIKKQNWVEIERESKKSFTSKTNVKPKKSRVSKISDKLKKVFCLAVSSPSKREKKRVGFDPVCVIVGEDGRACGSKRLNKEKKAAPSPRKSAKEVNVKPKKSKGSKILDKLKKVCCLAVSSPSRREKKRVRFDPVCVIVGEDGRACGSKRLNKEQKPAKKVKWTCL